MSYLTQPQTTSQSSTLTNTILFGHWSCLHLNYIFLANNHCLWLVYLPFNSNHDFWLIDCFKVWGLKICSQKRCALFGSWCKSFWFNFANFSCWNLTLKFNNFGLSFRFVLSWTFGLFGFRWCNFLSRHNIKYFWIMLDFQILSASCLAFGRC